MRNFAKLTATLLIYMICMIITLPPIYACGYCGKPQSPYGRPSHYPRPPPNQRGKPPHHGGCGGRGGKDSRPPHHSGGGPPIVAPPIIAHPPVIITPPSTPCPPSYGPPGKPSTPSTPGVPGIPGTPCTPGGGGPGSSPSPTTQERCPINALKLGLCLDVLGGLVHIGIGDPTKHVCCPLLQGLLEVEAALCLCTAIRLKVLNLNIYIQLALSVLAQCGITPPPDFICPPS